MIRLIASDLDGTFLSSFDTVSEINRAAVAAAHAQGIPFVVATGRPSRWLTSVRAMIDDVDTLAVVSNGAAILRLGSGEVLHTFQIDPGAVLPAVAAGRQACPGITFGLEYGETFGIEPGFGPLTLDQGDHIRVADLAELLCNPTPILKIVARHPELHSEELYQHTLGVFAPLAATFSYIGKPGMIEISAPGVSKAHALQVICSDLDIAPEDTATFGDMPNDLDMLHWSGQGFVMPNAHPSLLKVDLPVLAGTPETCVGEKIMDLLAAGT